MIYLGADHGGFELKKKIKEWLTQWSYQFTDLGPDTFDPEDDYPTYAFKVAEKVRAEDVWTKPWNERTKGILICRSAAGVVIAANKVKGVRAVAAFNTESAKHSREHNDANVLGVSGDWTDEESAQELIKTWLETEFSKEVRHQRRINQISEQEQLNFR